MEFPYRAAAAADDADLLCLDFGRAACGVEAVVFPTGLAPPAELASFAAVDGLFAFVLVPVIVALGMDTIAGLEVERVCMTCLAATVLFVLFDLFVCWMDVEEPFGY